MRSSTENIYQKKVNQVIDYISANLHQPLQLDVIAGKICVSRRQLLRIMRSALDESLYTYMARQRMERAIMYMQTEEMTLAELAARVGYDNPQSFSKAFRKLFGISPKAYINGLNARLQEYVKNSGGKYETVPSEICEEEDLNLIYIRIVGQYGEEKPYETAWNKLIKFLEEKQVLSAATRFIGLSFDDPNVTTAGQCRFYACATVDKPVEAAGVFGTLRLRKGKYAVYTLKGSYSSLQEFYNNISVNFNHTIRHGMPFEEYIHYTGTDSEAALTKIYIPIK